MKHKVKVTVLDKKLYPELQQQYCADPASGACPCYNVLSDFFGLVVSLIRVHERWWDDITQGKQ